MNIFTTVGIGIVVFLTLFITYFYGVGLQNAADYLVTKQKKIEQTMRELNKKDGHYFALPQYIEIYSVLVHYLFRFLLHSFFLFFCREV